MDNKYITFTGFCAVVLWSLGASVVVSDVGKVYDLCKDHLLELKDVGDHGEVVFNEASLKSPSTNPCIIKITACSSCRILVRVNTSNEIDFFCSSQWKSNYQCKLGCDYMYMFDTYYMNETLRYYRKWKAFENVSESSNIFIGFCHNYQSKYNFSLYLEVQRKVWAVEGSPDNRPVAHIMSPFFPKGYSQNQETYQYTMTNYLQTGHVKLVFDDWHLAPSSDFFFIDSNILGLVSGETSRPMVLSSKNTLTVKFRTGSSIEPLSREFLGFKATSTFLKNPVALPKTNCKDAGYNFNSYGGYIEFNPNGNKRQLYDCLWVLKKQTGYTGISIKIINFANPGYRSRGQNVVEVRSGVTSQGYTVAVIDQLDDIENGIPYKDTEGFYIRLNGSYDSSDTFAFVYASYKPYHECTTDMFQCGNGLCIHSSLKCDGHNNCPGDISDENACGDYAGHWDKSYQYTITIGVIIPMVISVFLIMVICLLFVMIRRCRRARMQEAGSSERLRTLSEDVARSRGRRRRRHRRHIFGDRDLPPTYDEAMQNPPGWYLNVAFANPVDPSLPQPPSYNEATGQEGRLGVHLNQLRSHSPGSTDSSHSELTMGSRNQSLSSSSSDEGDTWGNYDEAPTDGRRARRSRHVSSSDTENEETDNQSLSGSARIPPDGQQNARRHTENDQPPRPSPSSERSGDRSEHDEQKQDKVEKLDNVDSKCDPKKANTPTEFVIPDSTKVENEHQDNRSYASRIVQSVLGSKASHNPNRTMELRGGHSRNRSMSSESEAMPDDNRRRGKKKAKKAKGRKGKSDRDRAMECLGDTSLNTADSVPCNTAGASNCDTEDVQTQPDCSAVQISGGGQAGEYVADEGKVVENGPDISRENADYEMVVSVDNEDVMLVYDTNFCEIPQNQDHFSQSQSDPGQICQSSGVSMETESSGGYHGNIANVTQSQADVSDRSDVEASIVQGEDHDLNGNHGNRTGDVHTGQGRDSESGHVSPAGVRYISFTDDLGDDIFV